jgi:hypothetical protein
LNNKGCMYMDRLHITLLRVLFSFPLRLIN